MQSKYCYYLVIRVIEYGRAYKENVTTKPGVLGRFIACYLIYRHLGVLLQSLEDENKNSQIQLAFINLEKDLLTSSLSHVSLHKCGAQFHGKIRSYLWRGGSYKFRTYFLSIGFITQKY